MHAPHVFSVPPGRSAVYVLTHNEYGYLSVIRHNERSVGAIRALMT
jgi:hypothetical protein